MSGKPEENIHKGHRQRLRQSYLQNGLDQMNDVNVLELLLFYAVPRQDTNGIAHRLLGQFHTLHGVFDAAVEDLMALGGLTENAAVLVKLVTDVARKSQISRTQMEDILHTSEDCGDYLMPRFAGATEEKVLALALDGKCKVLGCTELSRGTVNSASFSIRSVVEFALRTRATSVVLAHNHTSGIAVPSREDIHTTRAVAEALALVGVALADHIVVADEDYVSMLDSGYIKRPGG